MALSGAVARAAVRWWWLTAERLKKAVAALAVDALRADRSALEASRTALRRDREPDRGARRERLWAQEGEKVAL